jgi:hypothetical protein
MTIRECIRALALAAASLGGARGSVAAEPDVYQAMRAAKPSGRVAAARALVLQRDAFRFTFEAGTFHALEAGAGQVFGAVFVGDGRYELEPATENERRHLGLVTKTPGLTTLQDTFKSVVLLFTDGTAKEIGALSPAGTPSDTAAVASVYDEHLKRQRSEYRTNIHLRLLQDMLDGPRPHKGAFLAFVSGARHGPVLAVHDPLGLEALRLSFNVGGEETALFKPGTSGGLWYLSRTRAQARAGAGAPARRLADALHYSIETTINADQTITGTTTVRLRTIAPGVRVLPMLLLSTLRVRAAALVVGGADERLPLTFVQEPSKDEGELSVILPAPQPDGATLTIRLEYAGRDVLTDAGEGNFTIGARTSWYANLGTFDDVATFDLTYRVPSDREVVSVGALVDDRVQGGARTLTWKADQPLRVAGFNYGRFKKVERMDADAGVKLQVFTNPGTPNVITEINQFLQAVSGDTLGGGAIPDAVADDVPVQVPSYVGPRHIQVTTQSLAESALVDASNMARVGKAYFGSLPVTRVAITQQAQWFFGQSWPALIYLPYLAFIDGTTRAQLGLASTNSFVDIVGPHEFAHQWWGHSVGFQSYRDQWLSEGFAEFSAALLLHHTGGGGRYDAFWENARKTILGRPTGATLANHEAGPITQGWRLATSANGQAYAAMVYAKGAYVLHMLRMMMWEAESKHPDAGFRAMVQDFAVTYAGKEPSTADFQKMVEKHMVPAMNATRDGKMDWFFGQWVHGTEIPRYEQDLKISTVAKDTYRIQGTVSQNDVSADFRALLPLYVELDKGSLSRVGVLPFVGAGSRPVDLQLQLPRKPRRAVFNARHDVLAKD